MAIIAPGVSAQPAPGRPVTVTGATAGPYLALPSGANARSQRGLLDRAYDDFISTGSVASLRPVVADSWRLSRASGVSPDGVLPVVDMLDAELEEYRSAHPLAAVMPLIRRLLIDEAETGAHLVHGATGLVVHRITQFWKAMWRSGSKVGTGR